MRWQDAYSDECDEDPFPKMLDDEPTYLLGPYVATEVGLVEKVRAQSPKPKLDEVSCKAAMFLEVAQPPDWMKWEMHGWCMQKKELPNGHALLQTQALHFAGVGPSDRVLDLGSGDGRFCVAAVQQFNAQMAVGIEIDESLVKLSLARAEQCGVSDKAIFLCEDLTAPDRGVQAASVCGTPTLVIVFLLPEAEQKFQELLMSLYNAGAHVLSLAFELDRLKGLQLRKKETPMYLYSNAMI